MAFHIHGRSFFCLMGLSMRMVRGTKFKVCHRFYKELEHNYFRIEVMDVLDGDCIVCRVYDHPEPKTAVEYNKWFMRSIESWIDNGTWRVEEIVQPNEFDGELFKI